MKREPEARQRLAPCVRAGSGGTSRFWGVTKALRVTEDGKSTRIARIAREGEAARAYDRVSVATLGRPLPWPN